LACRRCSAPWRLVPAGHQGFQPGLQLGEARGLGLVGQLALGLQFLGEAARLHQQMGLLATM
jgi:hypothetical protein